MGIYLGKNVHDFKHLLVRQTCCIALLKYVYVERSKPISHTFKKEIIWPFPKQSGSFAEVVLSDANLHQLISISLLFAIGYFEKKNNFWK